MKKIDIALVTAAIVSTAALMVSGVNDTSAEATDENRAITAHVAAAAATPAAEIKPVTASVISFQSHELAAVLEPEPEAEEIIAGEVNEPEEVYEELEAEPEYIPEPEVYEESDSCFGEEQQHGDEHDLIYLGNYRITFFCPEECCCGSWAGSPTASGAWPTSNHTVACGEDIPFGTTLLIDGQVYVCEDRGVPSGCVDIFVDSHSEAEQRGLYYTDVYIVR